MRLKRWAPVALTCLALHGIAAPAVADDTGLSTADAAFLRAAHQGNLAEIAAGQGARKNAMTDCVKRAGGILVADHTRLAQDIKALAGKLGVTLPGTLTAAQMNELAAVQAEAGTAAYDATWLDTQKAAHETGLELIDKQLTSGSNAEIKAAARAARPVVAMHLQMVHGGTCRIPSTPSDIHAGSGGQAAASADRQTVLGAAVLGGGGLLLATGWFLAVLRRRSAAGH
jgi:putative membrane protein